MKQIRSKTIKKLSAIFLLAAITINSLPTAVFAAGPTVDITANGQSGTLTLATSTDSFTVDVTSTGATTCEFTSPVASGAATSSTMTINPGHAYYPAIGGSTTFTVSCTDGVTSSTDSVTVSLPAITPPVATTTLSVDIKANGSDGPITINNGDPYTYDWTSTGATTCESVSPVASGATLNGTGGPIIPGHPFYPGASSPVTITISCTDGVTSVTDSVMISLASAPVATTTLAVDIKANGSDGPIVTINNGDSYTYDWTSTGATTCEFTSPVASGATLNGTGGPIAPGHSFYPTSASSTTFTVSCTDGVTSVTDSVTVALAGSTGGTSNPTVDIKANGSDGPVTIKNGDSYTYDWTSNNATTCEFTSPVASGTTLNGTGGPITPGHPFYPAVGSSITFTISCTNGVTSVTDSVVVNVVSGGGGGGSTHHGGGGGGSTSTVLPPVTTNSQCVLLTSYLRRDFNNDPIEVMKLQSFLKVFEGHSELTVNGVFDQATFNAVEAFQEKYRNDILAPWGETQPTGYVYILTTAAINSIYCGHPLTISPAQVQEVQQYHDTYHPPVIDKQGCPKTGCAEATSTISIPVVGESTPQGQTESTVDSVRNLASAVFAGPATLNDALQCIYEFLLILIVLYVVASLLENVLYKNVPENVRKRFLAKWISFSIGIVLAIVGAYLLKEWCLILPLMIALVMSVIWVLLYPKHNSLRASAKSWYLVTNARAKTIWNRNKTTPAVEVVESK